MASEISCSLRDALSSSEATAFVTRSAWKIWLPGLERAAHRCFSVVLRWTTQRSGFFFGTFTPRQRRCGSRISSSAEKRRGVSHSESRQFCASQSTPDEKCENRSVTLSAQVVWRRLAKQGPGLLHRQPVANPHAQTFRSLDTAERLYVRRRRSSCR